MMLGGLKKKYITRMGDKFMKAKNLNLYLKCH